MSGAPGLLDKACKWCSIVEIDVIEHPFERLSVAEERMRRSRSVGLTVAYLPGVEFSHSS